MTANSVYTKSDRATAIRLHKEGHGYKWISDIIGCSSSTISKWISDAISAGEPGLRRHPKADYPKRKRAKAIAEYVSREDLSLLSVAKKNGISHHTLRRWLRAAKVSIRPYKPAKYNREDIITDLKGGTLTRAQVADRHNCSESWVYRVWSGRG